MADVIMNDQEFIPVPADLSLDAPDIVETGKMYFTEFYPYADTFTSNKQIEVKITSDTSYLYQNRTGYAFNIEASASCILSSLGLASITERVDEVLGGTHADSLEHANLVSQSDLSTDTADQQVVYKDLFAFRLSSETEGSTLTTTPISVYVPFRSQTNGLTAPIPLPFCKGGLVHRITLPPDNVVINGTATYKITNFRIVACMVAPSPQIFAQHKSIIDNGGSLTLAGECSKVVRFSLGSVSSPRISVNIPAFNSLNSVHIVGKTAHANSKDFFYEGNLSNVKSWGLRVGSEKFPQGFNIGVCPTTSTSSKMNQAMALSVLSNKSKKVNVKYYDPLQKRSALVYGFKSHPTSLFTGCVVENGVVDFDFELTTAASTDEFYAILNYDTLWSVEKSMVSIKI